MIKNLLSYLTKSFLAGLIFSSSGLHAQSWTQEASFPGGGRQYSAYFATTTKGYIGFGNNQQVNDLWEYDPANNIWTKKAPIPTGGGRAEMIGFSIGNEGYVGMGFDTTGESNEFWKFDPPSNTWTQVAPYPGAWLRGAVVFTIGINAYVVAGVTTGGSPNYEVWAYNTTNNTWTQKSDLPNTIESYFGIGFAIGSQGYLGTGVIGSTAQDNFWEYDSGSDTWTQKGNAPGGIRVNAVGFSNSTNGFLGMGSDNVSVSYDDFWKYNPGSDTWTQLTNYAGAGRLAGAGFAIGCSSYMGTGFNGSGVDQSDFWQLSVCTSLPLTVFASQTNDSCYGSNNGTATADPSGGTPPYSYNWQPGGQTVPTVTGLTAGTYTVIVTDSLHTADTASVIITQPPAISVGISADTSICPGSSVVLTATGAITYTWSPATGLDSTTGATVMATPAASTTYTVTASISGCSGEDSVSVTVIPPSYAGTITADKDTICAGNYDNLTLAGDTGNILWQSSVNGILFITIAGTDSTTYLTQPSQTTYYRAYTTGTGCSDTSLPFKLVVDALPAAPTVTTNDSLLCSGDSTQICTANTFVSYFWNTGSTTYCTIVNEAGGYWVTVTDVNGCSAVSGHQNISVYPVPSVSIIEEGDTLSSFNYNSYQWYFNDSIIPGANTSVYVAHQTGDYAVQIVDTNGCNELSNNTPIIISGMADLPENSQLTIYPNPCTNLLFVRWNNASADLQGIEIYDVLGRTVLTKTIPSLSVDPWIIDISELPDGIYSVNIKTATQNYTQNIIKQLR